MTQDTTTITQLGIIQLMGKGYSKSIRNVQHVNIKSQVEYNIKSPILSDRRVHCNRIYHTNYYITTQKCIIIKTGILHAVVNKEFCELKHMKA